MFHQTYCVLLYKKKKSWCIATSCILTDRGTSTPVHSFEKIRLHQSWNRFIGTDAYICTFGISNVFVKPLQCQNFVCFVLSKYPDWKTWCSRLHLPFGKGPMYNKTTWYVTVVLHSNLTNTFILFPTNCEWIQHMQKDHAILQAIENLRSHAFERLRLSFEANDQLHEKEYATFCNCRNAKPFSAWNNKKNKRAVNPSSEALELKEIFCNWKEEFEQYL